MKTYQIHFIRHGITDGNLNSQYIGSTDLPLCDEGKKALARLSDSFDYPGAGAYIVSPMKRCIETLRVLYPKAAPIPIDDLRECDFGIFEGKTAAELKGDREFTEWIMGGASHAPYGGESGEHFSGRVCSSFESIVKGLMKTGTTSCVIVTHGGVISMLLSKYGLPKAKPTDWACEPGRGFSVRIHPQLWMTGNVMEVYSRLPTPKNDSDE